MFQPGQTSAIERLLFLKKVTRKGWTRHSIPLDRIESVADHSFGVMLLSWLFCPPGMNRSRVLELALIHDLAEVVTGDLTPLDGVPQDQKERSELEALHELVGGLPSTTEVISSLREYQEQVSPEARWVKNIDKLEMALQSRIYESEHGCDLSEFRESAAKYLQDLGLEWLNRERSGPS